MVAPRVSGVRDGRWPRAALRRRSALRPPPVACVSVPAPSASAETAANSTSVSITTAVVLAGRRAAPYCRARLLDQEDAGRARGRCRPTPAPPPAARGAARPGSGSWPASPRPARRRRNIASARPSSGRSASRRSMTLFSAKEKPPSDGQPVRERARQRQPGQPCCGPQHDRRAGDAEHHAQRRQRAEAFLQHQARQQHGPQRHEVEQQHDPDDVADDDGPVERGVGGAGGHDQDPERRRAQDLPDRARSRADDDDAGDGEDQRGRPERMQAVPTRGVASATRRCPRRAR